MRRSLMEGWMLLAICLIGVVSCEHRELVDVGNTHYVRVYIDDHLLNVTEGFYNEALDKPIHVLPTVMRVVLCNPGDGRVVAERYLQNVGHDERGYFMDGYIISPVGEFKLMAYNFGTETTQIRNESNYYLAEAFTNNVSSRVPGSDFPGIGSLNQQPVVYDPDHLYVISEQMVNIKPSHDIDSLKTVDGEFFVAKSIVKSYFLQINLRGAQWVSSTSGMISGMARTSTLYNRTPNRHHPAIVYFPMKKGPEEAIDYVSPELSEVIHTSNNRLDNADRYDMPVDRDKPQDAILYTTFNTFGQLQEHANLFMISMEIVKTDGTIQTEVFDISQSFMTPEAINHQWIILKRWIEVFKPKPKPGGGGGFTPGVDDWIDEDIEIEI